MFADNEDPVISDMPADIIQDAGSGLATGDVHWTPPTASDNSGTYSLSSSHSPGDSFSIGDTVVTYTAVDNAGNMVTENFTVTIEGNVLCYVDLCINLRSILILYYVQKHECYAPLNQELAMETYTKNAGLFSLPLTFRKSAFLNAC